jgi:iron(III) transport system substrate-binding protein
MVNRTWVRRDVLKTALAAAATVFAEPLRAAAPEPTEITPALIAAAKREGQVVYYTSLDLPVSERLAKTFEASFPGISVRVERSGAERVFQRLGQEYASRIHAVDVVNSSDAAHFVIWKRDGLLAACVPQDVASHYPAERRDPDGMYAGFRAGLNLIGYNIDLVKPQEAPRSFADLLDPRWAGRMVKAHPGYSGSIMTATYEMSRDLGWDFFEKLARQRVMQVQSATDPSKKLALGERAVMVDGNEHNMIQLKESGGPVEIVYPLEGTPLAGGPNGLFAAAPHPNAARLFQCFCFTAECQQLMSDFGGLRSFHPLIKEKAGRKPFREIKTMREDAAAVETMSEEIKARYAKLFGA